MHYPSMPIDDQRFLRKESPEKMGRVMTQGIAPALGYSDLYNGMPLPPQKEAQYIHPQTN